MRLATVLQIQRDRETESERIGSSKDKPEDAFAQCRIDNCYKFKDKS